MALADDTVLYRMARAESLSIVHLDSFSAVYHRASGITHLITAPAPEILATLGEAGMTRAALLDRVAPLVGEWMQTRYHVLGNGALCLFQTQADWNPSSSVVELLLKGLHVVLHLNA